MKALNYVLIAAAGCWISSEALEIAFGGRTSLTLGLTAAFHMLMVGGIWGAYAGQGRVKGSLSRVAARMASVGYLVLVYPPIAVAQNPSTTIAEYMGANPPFGAAGMLATAGVTLFGVAVLRSHSYPAWIGLTSATSPMVFAATMLFDGPPLVGVAANVVLGSAFVAIGILALRTPRGASAVLA